MTDGVPFSDYVRLFTDKGLIELANVAVYFAQFSSYDAVRNNPTAPHISWEEYTEKISQSRELQEYLQSVIVRAVSMYPLDKFHFDRNVPPPGTLELAPASDGGIIRFSRLLSDRDAIVLLDCFTMRAEVAYYKYIYSKIKPGKPVGTFLEEIVENKNIQEDIRFGVRVAISRIDYEPYWDWNTLDWRNN